MSDDLTERDLDELIETLVLAFGDAEPGELRLELQNLRKLVEENARKRHARLLRPKIEREETLRWMTDHVAERHPRLAEALFQLDDYLRKQKLLTLPGQAIQVAGLRVTRQAP